VPRPFRANFILGLVAVGAALAAVGGWRYARASAPVSGPIIVISVDGLRADRLPIYGGQQVETPAIDALAADSVVFDRAYSHTPQTLPAHASLLSGRLPFDTGVRDDLGFKVRGGERMLAEMLSDRGYETGAVVSSYALREATGIAQGFAFFDAPEGSSLPASEDGGDGLERDGARTVQAAEDWLDGSGGTRVFLWLHLTRPESGARLPGAAHTEAAYASQIAGVDESVNQFVRYLKTHQLYDQATIFLLADHGVGLDDHGEQGHGLLVYEEAVRVPLLVKQAAGKGAGTRAADLVQHVDIAPTILDLAKAPLPGNLRGRSLASILDGESLPPRIVYSESLYGHYRFGWAAVTSVTDGRYRLIRAPHEELYDLERDPKQTDNLLDGDTQQLEAPLRSALDRWTNEEPVDPAGPVRADDRERLQRLGSVGLRGTSRGHEGAGAAGAVAPRTKTDFIERYRRAVAASRRGAWGEALALMESLVRSDPSIISARIDMADAAVRAGRPDQAIDAYQEVIALEPAHTDARLALTNLLLRQRRFDDAETQANGIVSLEGALPAVVAAGHELLARAALNRRDVDTAQEQAALAWRVDSGRPVPGYIEGRLQFDRGMYREALAAFLQAADTMTANEDAPVIADLQYYLGETLVRLDRPVDAETHFVAELRQFPSSIRAWTSLATLYQNTERSAEAARTLKNMLQVLPTADAYAAAARTWTAFGDAKQAAELRLEAQRAARSH
jgi:tetratricopeptide (TPR) repeat protein